MSQSKYHLSLISHIHKFGLENKAKYLNCCIGAKNPLYINHPQAKRKNVKPIQYEPDVYLTTKKKGKIVFEVLDSELNKTSEIISDMIQCCIAADIIRLIFIIPTKDENEINRIADTFDVISDTLVNLGINKKWIPKLGVYYILKKESRKYDKVKRALEKLSKTDRW